MDTMLRQWPVNQRLIFAMSCTRESTEEKRDKESKSCQELIDSESLKQTGEYHSTRSLQDSYSLQFTKFTVSYI